MFNLLTLLQRKFPSSVSKPGAISHYGRSRTMKLSQLHFHLNTVEYFDLIIVCDIYICFRFITRLFLCLRAALSLPRTLLWSFSLLSHLLCLLNSNQLRSRHQMFSINNPPFTT